MLENKNLDQNIKTMYQHIVESFDIESAKEYYDNTGYLLAAPTAEREHMFIRVCQKHQKATLKISALNKCENANHFFSQLYMDHHQVRDVVAEWRTMESKPFLEKVKNCLEQYFKLPTGSLKVAYNAFDQAKIDLIVDISQLSTDMIDGIKSILMHYGLTAACTQTHH